MCTYVRVRRKRTELSLSFVPLFSFEVKVGLGKKGEEKPTFPNVFSPPSLCLSALSNEIEMCVCIYVCVEGTERVGVGGWLW